MSVFCDLDVLNELEECPEFIRIFIVWTHCLHRYYLRLDLGHHFVFTLQTEAQFHVSPVSVHSDHVVDVKCETVGL